LISPYFRPIIKQWLTAPIIDQGRITIPKRGTPQGGVISPLLMNIALHGLENLPGTQYIGLFPFIVKYADDFIVIDRTKKSLIQHMNKVNLFLMKRGLQLNREKTRIILGMEAYQLDFLGFSIIKRQKGLSYPRLLLVKPEKEKVKRHYHKIKTIINQHKTSTQEELIRVLNPVIRGYAQYYRHSHCSEMMGRLDHLVVRKLWRWCMRRHKNKNMAWIRNKYWLEEGKKWWIFSDKKNRLALHYEVAYYKAFEPGPVWANPYSVRG
jgi:RNA-directed DNA polymerase